MLENRALASKYPNLDKYSVPVKPPAREIIGRDKEMHSVLAGISRPELSNVILIGEAGSGKALRYDTFIPVADERGYVQIKDIKVGDRVFDENGQPTTVLGVYPQGKKRAYRVTLADNTSVVCNDEHLWAARTRSNHYDHKPYKTVTLREMMDYGIVRQLASGSIKSWYIPMPKAVERESVQLPLHPYVVGALIGDGYLAPSAKDLEISSDDEPVVARIAKLLGTAGYERTKSNNHSWHFLRNDTKMYHGQPLKYLRKHEFLGLGLDDVFNKKSIERRIPQQYLLGSVEQRFELLHGLMDTDGTVTDGDRTNCSFATNSKGLAEDFVELVTSLGMRATIIPQERRDTIHHNTEYEVHISCDDNMKPNLFWLDRHKQKFETWHRTDKRYYKHYDDIAVASVEDLGYETEMICIYVDASSHLFQVTKNHIVTHNTALVQGVSKMDTSRVYWELDMAKMRADIPDPTQMGAQLKALFDEVGEYCQEQHVKLVLFIDEFHQVVQLSAAAVEALKPLLADSGTRGICVICATTEKEFRQYIAPNQPLVERLQRINLNQPDKATTISILKGMAKKYGVDQFFFNDSMFEKIYEYTERYVPANSQPRKSILILDAMVGWHNAFNKKLDMALLGDVIYESEGVNVAFKVDATNIKKQLDSKVFAQGLASSAIESRLQICCADLNNKDKPMSSFLFCGSTGVGKMLADDVLIPVHDGRKFMKRNGDLQVGDEVFDRLGRPTKVTGVFPKGLQDVYEVEFADGRKIQAGGEHLWTYKSSTGNGAKTWKVANTLALKELLDNGNVNRIRYVVPSAHPVQWHSAAGRRSDWYAAGRQCALDDTFNFIAQYKGSIEQRWAFIQGLFDINGQFSGPKRRYELVYYSNSSEMVYGIQSVLWSLGVMSSVSHNPKLKQAWKLLVKCPAQTKLKFFTLEHKLGYAKKAVALEGENPKKRHIDYDVLGIRSIKKLSVQKTMTCISVDNDEQLYQAGDFIVTHNTEMTKQLANILFNDERNLLRFDMTEYANEDSLERFRRELTAKVWFKPYSIVLLDEIEKACAPVVRILLQVLDDGRLIDENNREVSFCNCYMVLTTNAGSEIFRNISQYGESDTGDGSGMKDYNKLIRRSISQTTGDNRFPPELLGRIDTIVPFQPLSRQTMVQIVKSKLMKLMKQVADKHNIRLFISDEVIDFLTEDNLDTDSNSGGARVVVSKLEETVTTEVSRFINAHPSVQQVFVTVEGEMAKDNKYKRTSQAHILVTGKGERK